MRRRRRHSTIRPTTSMPGTNGSGGLIWYRPADQQVVDEVDPGGGDRQADLTRLQRRRVTFDDDEVVDRPVLADIRQRCTCVCLSTAAQPALFRTRCMPNASSESCVVHRGTVPRGFRRNPTDRLRADIDKNPHVPVLDTPTLSGRHVMLEPLRLDLAAEIAAAASGDRSTLRPHPGPRRDRREHGVCRGARRRPRGGSGGAVRAATCQPTASSSVARGS